MALIPPGAGPLLPGKIRALDYQPMPAQLGIHPIRQDGKQGAMLIIDNAGGSAAAYIGPDELGQVIDRLTELHSGITIPKPTNPLGVIR